MIVKNDSEILNAIESVRQSVLTRVGKSREEATNISFKRFFVPLDLEVTKNLLEVLKKTLLETLFKDTNTTAEDLWPCLRDGDDLAENARLKNSGPHILTKPNVLLLLLTTYSCFYFVTLSLSLSECLSLISFDAC